MANKSAWVDGILDTFDEILSELSDFAFDSSIETIPTPSRMMAFLFAVMNHDEVIRFQHKMKKHRFIRTVSFIL
jgi:hypothetical protein